MALETAFASKLVQPLHSVMRRHRRFLRFLVVGFVNTVFGYSLFALIYFATGRHNIAIVIATTLGVLFNFFTTGRIVFGNRNAWAIVPFVLSYVLALGLNIWLLDILVRLGISALVAQALCLPAVVATSYLVNARIVFRNRDDALNPP
jgi:putative flippase GtrA